ncbi:NAD(P)H-dependent flavin oxidoreductase [Paenibacillus contaminans]|uniref:Probable nitronate monooxygenase n=1 Tax=Paenibacillus contaminans TaxID=450362 RepID=A0A329MLJ0_9BACL|nr:nitronate monooxygenase [Paenibacillus contaminans]RAV20438.1 nitronate monooxygenase [Paenibacillus contaminans]
MNITMNTDLCRLLAIRHPIIQAGMAGGPTTPGLVAAVSEAGGLGTLGAAYMKPSDIREAIAAIRKLTDRPFGVNLFVTSMKDDWSRNGEVQPVLDSMRRKLSLDPAGSSAPPATPDWVDAQIALLLEERVPVISTAFGVLPEREALEAQRLGIRNIAMATTVKEARQAELAGADAIVAQGAEAGGHRGTFDVSANPLGANIGTLALVPQIADAVRIPVIAAGGIMDGRGLVAALALGAQGAQLGTRFLTAAEAGTHAAYRESLLGSDAESTAITTAFSGRPARGIRNSFVRDFEQAGLPPLPFPSQNTATRDIRNAAAAQHNAEYMSLWAGQGTSLLTNGQDAGQIIREIVRQAEAIIG